MTVIHNYTVVYIYLIFTILIHNLHQYYFKLTFNSSSSALYNNAQVIYFIFNILLCILLVLLC